MSHILPVNECHIFSVWKGFHLNMYVQHLNQVVMFSAITRDYVPEWAEMKFLKIKRAGFISFKVI